MSELSGRDNERLRGVHPDLVAVVRTAFKACPIPLLVVEGLRTRSRQIQLYAQGRTAPGKIVTWTLKSKHIEGRAVDLCPKAADGSLDWNNLKAFDTMGAAMKAAAKSLGVAIRWGADWDGDGKLREKGESDSPHFELAD